MEKERRIVLTPYLILDFELPGWETNWGGDRKWTTFGKFRMDHQVNTLPLGDDHLKKGISSWQPLLHDALEKLFALQFWGRSRNENLNKNKNLCLHWKAWCPGMSAFLSISQLCHSWQHQTSDWWAPRWIGRTPAWVFHHLHPQQHTFMLRVDPEIYPSIGVTFFLTPPSLVRQRSRTPPPFSMFTWTPQKISPWGKTQIEKGEPNF